MKKFNLFAVMAVMAMMAMVGCKYDEGPAISFLSAEERLGNTWVVSEVDKNGTLDTQLDGFKEITFFMEGACQIIFNPLGVEFGYTGTWVFNDKKTEVTLNLDDDLTGTLTYESVWTILRLKNEELKVSYTDGSDSYKILFRPAP